ncbi:YjhT family mutarotase [Vibrio sp. 404]|uniref:YjhT family mutarotase n=1 Tax=Vibrio marinisediminis TaxID=2758441 RepID=A0A7W2FUS0_9VIBR|nr:YjhT family mutarotase [Vibrio marinisediminis]MBA5764628.1 YjhT family mutarotase [Vibrio marinisediminis]
MKMHFSPLPSLPVGLKNGVGFAQQDVIYAGLGSLGSQWLMLDIASGHGWQAKAPFPGTSRNDAVCIAVAGGCYVLSGAGVIDGYDYPTVLTDGYFYNCTEDSWHLVTDQIPVGLLGAAGSAVGEYLFLIGGYNKCQFDGLMAQLNSPLMASDPDKKQACLVEFMSKPIEDYQWNDKIFRFELSSKQWQEVGENPFQANCGAGVLHSNGSLVLVEGEVKPGLRSLHTKQYQFEGGKLAQANYLASIIECDPTHEGLAGAYCGEINGLWVVAGGAFFIGSQSNYRTEKHYSHQGLSKTFSDAVWCFDGCEWQLAGQLPQGGAYGVSVTTPQGMVLLGGESQQGEALTYCYLLT